MKQSDVQYQPMSQNICSQKEKNKKNDKEERDGD